jgi:hypothetical protein
MSSTTRRDAIEVRFSPIYFDSSPLYIRPGGVSYPEACLAHSFIHPSSGPTHFRLSSHLTIGRSSTTDKTMKQTCDFVYTFEKKTDRSVTAHGTCSRGSSRFGVSSCATQHSSLVASMPPNMSTSSINWP